MTITTIAGVVVTPLKTIATDGGAVLHGLRQSDNSFAGFGEAYFSKVNHGSIRGWKKHQRMTLNLVVPAGAIRFVIIDDRAGSDTRGNIDDLALSANDHYSRLTVPPGLWMGFQGIGTTENLLLNIASIEHDPAEADQRPLDAFGFAW